MEYIQFFSKLEELQLKLLSYNNPKRWEDHEVYKFTDKNKKISADEEIRVLQKNYTRVGSINEVSNYGRVWVDGNIEIKKGDHEYIVEKNGYSDKIHRLVALIYCPLTYCNGPFWKRPVHHIDDNGFNNHYSNLLWVTYGQHATIHLKDSVWCRESYQLEFKGNRFYLNKQDAKIINGEFKITDDVTWDNKNEKPNIQLKIEFNADKMNREFRRNEWTEIYIGGYDLFSGKWKLQ
jgi:hypothetical protein